MRGGDVSGSAVPRPSVRSAAGAVMYNDQVTPDPLGELIAAYDNDFARIEAELAMRKGAFRRSQLTSTSDAPVVLRATALHKTYRSGRNSVAAVRDVNFDVRAGEMVALTGPSGSGKSTVLNLLSGLDRPDSGSIDIAGTEITKLSKNRMAAFRCRHVGFVFQFFYLQPFLNLVRNVTVPAMFLDRDQLSATEREDYASSLIQSVGLADRARHLPRELSGGQMQRAAIARALVNKPQLVLADEPTGNLDSANAQGIMELFDSLRRGLGTAVVIVTHDPKIAAQADRIVELIDGEVAS